jgi:EmrB/QacA subfamily drug resistance transporter
VTTATQHVSSAGDTRACSTELDPRRWLALGVVLLAAFINILDTGIVFVAIPSIQADLRASYSAIQWMAAGYTFAFAVGLITGGRLGDIFGRRRMFLLGVAGFTVASALSGFAVSPAMLVGSRVLQGAMAAVMVPQILSTIQVSFPPHEQRKAYGAYGAMIGVGSVAAPLVGGVLIAADAFGLGWRPIFLINVPVGIFAIVAAAAVMRESKSPSPLRLDLVGVVIVTIGLLALLYPLVQGRDLGWPAWTFVSMAVSAPVLGLFAIYEQAKTRKDGSPLVAVGLFGQRTFVAGQAAILIFFSGVAGFFLVVMLYLQAGLGFSALRAGLTLVAFPVGLIIASATSVRVAPRLGRAVTASGALVMAGGMASLLFMIGRYGIDIRSWQFAPSLLMCGLGLGMVAPTLVDVVLAAVPHRDAGSASGVLNTTLQLGNAVGVALIGVIFFGLLPSRADAGVEQVVPQIQAGLAAQTVSAKDREQIVDGFARCVQDQMTSQDPSAAPPSCRERLGGGLSSDHGIARVVDSAATQAQARIFTWSMQRSLRFEIGVFLLSFGLMFLLPKTPRAPTPRQPTSKGRHDHIEPRQRSQKRRGS